MLYDVIIVGAGSAGSSAAIYATRYNLKTLMLGGPMPGGLITEATEVENYPGYLSISGMELSSKFIKQAEALGAEYRVEVVESIKKQNDTFVIKTYNSSYESKSVILATGTKHKKLGIEGEYEFSGRGVSYCSTCDGPFFRNMTVAVIGAGNSAVEGAQEIASFANQVYLIYRSTDKLAAAPIYVEHMRKNPKITEISGTNVVKILGDMKVNKIMLDKPFNGSVELDVNGVFIQIGYEPQNQLAKELGVELTQSGYVIVDQGHGTSIKGAFCAGDLSTASNMLHQQITSASGGAIAAQSAYRFINNVEYIVSAH